LGAAQNPGRQGDQSPEQFKNPADGNAQKAERQQKEPNQRIEQEGQQSQRPANDQQYQPKQEFTHAVLLSAKPPLAKPGKPLVRKALKVFLPYCVKIYKHKMKKLFSIQNLRTGKLKKVQSFLLATNDKQGISLEGEPCKTSESRTQLRIPG
jgi:hypothetical protein